MRTFVSTKIGAVMNLLAGQISAIGLQEGLARKCPTHGALIAVYPKHSLFQGFPQEA
jgi:hypothetical protein